jgi:hypothetical protein
VSRLAGPAAAILLAFAGASQAAPPPVTLKDGQTRWFVAGKLRPGQEIRCRVGGRTFTATFSKGKKTSGTVWFDTVGHGTIQIAGRGNGAAQVSCGSATVQPRYPTLPYVIGQNGVALIRGANRRSQLRRAFGPPTSRDRCVTTWGTIGLRATFAGKTCAAGDPLLTTATALGPKWSTLLGARIGDDLAEMLWLQPGAKKISTGRWRLASARHKKGRSTLYAVIGKDGKVAAFRYEYVVGSRS